MMRSSKVREMIKKEAEYRLNCMYEEKRLDTYDFKKILAFHLGSILYEDWKDEDEVIYENSTKEEKNTTWKQELNGELRRFEMIDQKLGDIYYKDHIFVFKEDDPAYRKKERKVDVRALDFKELPFAFKKIYEERGSWVIDLLYDEVMVNGERDVKKILSKSESYKKLSKDTRENYKRYVNLGYGLLKELREGNITIDEMLEEDGISLLEFDIQKERIQKAINTVLPKNLEWQETTKFSHREISELAINNAILQTESKGVGKLFENFIHEFKIR